MTNTLYYTGHNHCREFALSSGNETRGDRLHNLHERNIGPASGETKFGNVTFG